MLSSVLQLEVVTNITVMVL